MQDPKYGLTRVMKNRALPVDPKGFHNPCSTYLT
jgi:hypothetical protein